MRDPVYLVAESAIAPSDSGFIVSDDEWGIVPFAVHDYEWEPHSRPSVIDWFWQSFLYTDPKKRHCDFLPRDCAKEQFSEVSLFSDTRNAGIRVNRPQKGKGESSLKSPLLPVPLPCGGFGIALELVTLGTSFRRVQINDGVLPAPVAS